MSRAQTLVLALLALHVLLGILCLVIARIGGEEFLVLFPQSTLEGARDAAERLRVAISRAEVRAGGEPLPVTASGGVALYPGDGMNFDQLFAVADRRLYEAKRSGRNRIAASDPAS